VLSLISDTSDTFMIVSQIARLVPSSSLATSLSSALIAHLAGLFAKGELYMQVLVVVTRISSYVKLPPSSLKIYARPSCSGNHIIFTINIREPHVIYGSSGDDHDYCEWHHRLEDGSTIREITVKSFSMAMGILRPGFQLLSVASPNHGGGHLPYDALADVPCLLPDQIKIYTHGYAPLGVVTVFLLFLINYSRRRRRRQGDTAWTETAQSYAYSSSGSSDPSTYTKLRHSPEHSVSPAQSTPINNPDNHGDEDWPGLPLAGSYMYPPGLRDMTSLPSPAQYPPHPRWTRIPRIRILDTPFSGGHRLFAFFSRRAQTCRTWWRGVDQQAWYSIAIKDFCAVAWPPLSVYTIISVWLFWW
jgi:ethanolamine phosphate phosphodiesterase